MARKGVVVLVKGVEYNSASDAARALAKGGMTSSSEIAKVINEAAKKDVISAQTVAAALDKNGKVAARHMAYRALHLAKTGNYSANMISERVEISKAALNEILKEAGIEHLPTKEDIEKRQKEEAAKKPAKEKPAKKSKKAKKVKKDKEPEAAPVDNTVTETPEPVAVTSTEEVPA